MILVSVSTERYLVGWARQLRFVPDRFKLTQTVAEGEMRRVEKHLPLLLLLLLLLMLLLSTSLKDSAHDTGRNMFILLQYSTVLV